jgi:hypothetical protein
MSSFTEPLVYEFTGSFYHGRPLYVITKEFSYSFGSIDSPVAVFRVPEGFNTDFASIPWPFRLWFPPDGPWAKAAVVHDFLCNNPYISNIAKDSIFYESLRVLRINTIISYMFFTAVRIYHSFFATDTHNQQWINKIGRPE